MYTFNVKEGKEPERKATDMEEASRGVRVEKV